MLDFLLGHWAMDCIIGFVLFSVGFIIALCTSLLVSEKITKKILGVSVVVGLFYKEINSFIYSLYEPFYQGNPQVSTVLILIGLSLALGVGCAFKKWRSIDRVFGFTMITASTLIWVICHVAMIHKGLIFNIEQTIKHNENAVATFVKNDQRDAFYDFCNAAGLVCNWSTDEQPTKEFVDTYKEKTKFGYNVVEQIKYGDSREVFDRVIAKSAYQLDEEPTNTALTMVRNSDTQTVASVFDNKNVNSIHETTIVYFYSWFALALLFWVWGGMSLLGFHHWKFNKREQAQVEAHTETATNEA